MEHSEKKQSVSIIIPTYREAENIPLLITKIAKLNHPHPLEVIIVDDDSQDGTFEIIQKLHSQHPWLRCITRTGKRSWDQSILAGIQAARHDLLLFMDADLSHPPERIPEMLTLIQKPDIDLVIGSRYMQGGQIDKTWPWYRQWISRLATWVIQPLLIAPLTDPLSGFIAVKSATFATYGCEWKPLGTKLALEILVKSNAKNVVEIPICFEQRKLGESKLMNARMAMKYAQQVINLWLYRYSRQRHGHQGHDRCRG